MKEEMADYLPLSQMEDSEKQNSSLIPIKSRNKGGLITMTFIIANEALENVASYGLLPNMTNYLMGEYRMGFTTTQNLLFFWSAATNFLPIVGAVVADSYLGRFLTIGLWFHLQFHGLGMAVTYLLASVILSAVDKYTKGEGKESWVSSNINKGYYEYYYWLLALLTAFNLIYFMACCWQYGPSVDVDITIKMMEPSDDENDNDDER